MTVIGKTFVDRRNSRRYTWPGIGVPCALLSALIIFALKVCTVVELSPITYWLKSESQRCMTDVTFQPLKLVYCALRTNLMTSSSVISLGIMITLTCYVVILLYRKIIKHYTRTRALQRRKFVSGYWTRRRIYWRRRAISRTGYIDEAIQASMKQLIDSESESLERKEEMLTKPCQDILKRNGYALSGGKLDADLQNLNKVMLYQKKIRCSSIKGKRSSKKRGGTSKKMLSFLVNYQCKPVKKQRGFRRRTGIPSKSSTVDGHGDPKRLSRVRNFSRRKKKRKNNPVPIVLLQDIT